jgi:hypothetical protein
MGSSNKLVGETGGETGDRRNRGQTTIRRNRGQTTIKSKSALETGDRPR